MPTLSPRAAGTLVAAVAVAAALAPRIAPAAEPSEMRLQVNPTLGETQEEFARRTAWWRNARFGMFIHWGVYSVPADSTDRNGHKGIGEWYFSNKQMQVRDYEQFAKRFNPTGFNADEWAKLARDAGMRYITITSKHHDGFSMFGTHLTPYNIVDATPFHRDPMKELAAACRRNGLKLDFYYSIMDWHHPDYLPRRKWDDRPAEGADYNRYQPFMEGQLRELLTNYGPIGGIWFDGGWEGDAERHRSVEVARMIHSLQPGAMINDRGNLPGDYATPEQSIPANALPNGRLWETCMTMNDTWGYAANDTNWKSATDLTRKLIDIASKGGNFLLNVGPRADGRIPPESVERLHAVGAWMKGNSASIYGTTQSPWRRTPFNGRCTVKGNTLYLHVFEWPEGTLKLPPLGAPVVSAKVLATSETLKVDSSAAGVSIARPGHVDPVATTVEVRLSGPPHVIDPETVVSVQTSAATLLHARDARIHGNAAQLQGSGDTENIGYWTDPADTVEWHVSVPNQALYAVSARYACESGFGGSEYSLDLDGQPSGLRGKVDETGSWSAFRDQRLGHLMLTGGPHTVRVRPVSKPGGAVMNLSWLKLQPVPVSGKDDRRARRL